MAKLNEKQKLFAMEYLKSQNATKAYLAVYSTKNEDTARKNGSKLLTNTDIQAMIEKHGKLRQNRTEITADRIVMEIAKVAFADIGLVCDWNEEGKLTLKSKENMGPEGLASLNMIQSVDSFDKDGNIQSTKNSFKMNDKLKALELLSKHLGLLDGIGAKKPDQSGNKGRLQGIVERLGIGTSRNNESSDKA